MQRSGGAPDRAAGRPFRLPRPASGRGAARRELLQGIPAVQDVQRSEAQPGDLRDCASRRAPEALMRIGLLIDSLIGGGAERVVLNLATQFQARGHDVHIFLVRNEIEFDLKRNPAVVHSLSESGRLSALRPLNKWRLANRLKAKVREIEDHGGAFAFFLSNAE